MEIDAMLKRKLKIRKKLIIIRDIILVLLGCIFILFAFVYNADINHAIGDSMQNIRYGLFSFGLIISGTAIIIAVYFGRKKELLKITKQKLRNTKK
jgi:NADH:ubiquinone oxidoreductase subunit 6 (subunit J)